MGFAASRIFVGEIDGILTVAMAERQDWSGQSVFLQRAPQLDEQDLRLGIDTYSVSTQTGATAYDAISGWSVADHQIVLQFDRESARSLGTARQTRIDMPPRELAAVTELIGRITRLEPG